MYKICTLIVWDPDKARTNLKKHGVRFSDAEAVLLGPHAITLEDETAEEGRRFVSIGADAVGRVWSSFTLIGAMIFASFRRGRANRREKPNMKKEYDFSKGRPGAVIRKKGKTRITIYIDDDVLEEFRERADKAGYGYQTMMNQALREYLGRSKAPVDENTLRRVIREELQASR